MKDFITTEDLIEELTSMNYVVSNEDNRITIRDTELDHIYATTSTNTLYQLDTFHTMTTYLTDFDRGRLLELLFKYATTPLRLRERHKLTLTEIEQLLDIQIELVVEN